MKRSIARIKSSFQGLRDRLKRSRKRRTRRKAHTRKARTRKAHTRKAHTRKAHTRKAHTRSHRGGYDGAGGEIRGDMKPRGGGG